MATVIGDRDVLLLGSSQRALNPLNSGILLSASAPAFKVDTSGNPLPSTITIKASLLGIAGTVVFNATGATVTDNHDNTCTLAYSSLTGTSCTVTASITVNGQAFSTPITLSKVTDGTAGGPGATGNQYATAFLYQWSSTTPANPTGTSGYTWATGVNSTYTASDGWSVTVPSNPGTPGIKLYVASVQITAAGGTTSTVVSYATASVQAWTQNGVTGASGVQSATVQVYQWAVSIPLAPSGSPTYTWLDGSLSVVPSGWSTTPGTAPAQGMTLWAARAFITDSAANTTTTFSWVVSSIVAVGYSGSNGAAGVAGASYVTAYCASATTFTTTQPPATTGKTSLPATNSGGIIGTWSATVPTLSTGQFMYQSDGIYDPSTDQVIWSIPYWSSLKVGNLSAITVNTGNLTVSGTIADASNNWVLDSSGNMTANSVSLKGNIKGGSYTSYLWPSGGGTGYYLGPEGLLLGNFNSGPYFQVEANGNVHSNQFSIVSGAATFSGLLSAATGTFAGSLSAASGTFAGTLTASQVVTTQNLVDNAATDTALVQSTSVAVSSRSSSAAPSSNSDYTTLVTYTFTPVVSGVVAVHYSCFVDYTPINPGSTYGADIDYIKIDTGGFSSSDNTKRLNNGAYNSTFTGTKRLSVTAGTSTTIYFRCSSYMNNMTALASDIQMIIEIIKK